MRYFILGLVLAAGMAQAGSDYTLKKGISWSGVVVGSLGVRGSDFICRRSECYPLRRFHLSSGLIDTYQVRKLSFAGLEHTAIAREGDRITLPDDLGQSLFLRSRDLERAEDDRWDN